LTLACNLRCSHCGSIAGRAKRDELSLKACLNIVDQLADLGCELITLSGGEPTLKRGWDQIARRCTERGIYTNMVTNGVFKSPEAAREIARRARRAGMSNVGISIDGPQEIHDAIRGPGSFKSSMESVRIFGEEGMSVAVMTTVHRSNYEHLETVRALAIEAGARMWRLQLGKSMGNLEQSDLISPNQIKELIPRLARLKRKGKIHLAVGDSIGYYGPHDRVLRGRGWRGRREEWRGCQAGMQAIGIEADGSIKGCLSLQAKMGAGANDPDPFVDGNLKKRSLASIWYSAGVFAYNRDFDPESLSGGCAACEHALKCRGGARCVSSALGDLSSDPYCYHGLTQRKQDGLWAQGRKVVAGAALAMSLGMTGCTLDEDIVQDDAEVVMDGGVSELPPRDAAVNPDSVATDYGVIPPDSGVDAVATDYGVPPDAEVQPEVGMDYGVIPEPDAEVQPEVGMD